MKEIKNTYGILTDKWHSEILTARCVKYPDITIKTLQSIIDVLKLNSVWNDLVLNSSSATIYQTFEWLYNWWNYFAADRKNLLHVLLIFSSEKLVAIAPFYIKRYSFGGLKIYQLLKLIGSGLNSGQSNSNAVEEHGLSDYLDIIVLDGYEKKVADAVAAYLYEFKYFFNEIDFQNISEESFIFTRLLPLLDGEKFKIGVIKTDVCPRLKVPGSMENYLKSLRGGTRRKFRQIQKQTVTVQNSLHDSKNSYTKIKDVNDADFLHSLQILKQLHQNRWNELGNLGLFSDKRFENFIEHVGKTFYNKGWLWFKAVEFNNKIIAARLAYKFENRIYDYLSGFDSSQHSASLRPGITLIFIMIKDAVLNNFKTVDFLRGAEDYKFEMSSDTYSNYRISVSHSGSASGLIMKLFYIMMLHIKFTFRIKTEIAMIKLHKEKHGKIMFLYPYLKFCLNRFKALAEKQKVKNYTARKIPVSKSKNDSPVHISRKNKSYHTRKMEEVGIR